MKHTTLIVLVSILLSACQQPDPVPDVTITGRPTDCVGGGCSTSAAAEMKFEVSAQGSVSYSAEHLPPKSPLDENGNETTGLWGSFIANLSKYWSPNIAESERPASVPLPKPDEGASESGTIVGDATGGGSDGPTLDEIERGDVRDPPKNNGGGLRGSELDKAVNNIGRHVGAAWDEITGKGRKKRKEAREAKRKYNEGMALKNQIEGMATDMDVGSRVIEGVVREVLDPAKFTPTGDLKNVTRELASEHNVAIDTMIGETADIAEVVVPAEAPRYDTPELRSIQRARQYQTYVQNKIDAMPEGERAQRQPAVDMANNAFTVAESAYRAGDNEKGDYAKDLGLAGLDLALSLTPGVGLAKDIVELSTGFNFVTGAKLTTFERTLAAVGCLTFGYGSKLAIMGKAGALVDIVKAGTKNPEAIAESSRIISKAEEAAISFEKMGFRSQDEIGSLRKNLTPSSDSTFSFELHPRGPGASVGPTPEGYVKVQRWISESEVKSWYQGGGTRIPTEIGANGRVYVTAPTVPKPGGTGNLRVDMEVPKGMLTGAGNEGWFQILQPNATTPIHNVKILLP